MPHDISAFDLRHRIRNGRKCPGCKVAIDTELVWARVGYRSVNGFHRAFALVPLSNSKRHGIPDRRKSGRLDRRLRVHLAAFRDDDQIARTVVLLDRSFKAHRDDATEAELLGVEGRRSSFFEEESCRRLCPADPAFGRSMSLNQ